MPTLHGLKFRAGLIANALTLPFEKLVVHPRGSAGLFDFLADLVPGLPAPPPELSAAGQPEAGQQRVIESSEPEVARTLFTLARLLAAKRVVEVGVFRGYTSQFLAAAVAPSGGTLHLVDLSAAALDEAAARAAAFHGCRVRKHLGRSDAADVLADVPADCDLVYLDAAHSEDGVEAELAGWLPRVRPRGFVAVHDTVNLPGVCRAVNRQIGTHDVLTLATGRGSGLTLLRIAPAAASS